MSQLFKKAILTTAAVAGFINLSPAAEPPQRIPVEIVGISTKDDGSKEESRKTAVMVCLAILGGLGAFAYTRGRQRSDSSHDDDPWAGFKNE